MYREAEISFIFKIFDGGRKPSREAHSYGATTLTAF